MKATYRGGFRLVAEVRCGAAARQAADRRPGRNIAWVLFIASLVSSQAAPAQPSLPVLTTTDQISRLTAEQAGRSYPLRIRGVITYADMKLGHAFIQDESGATFAYFDPITPQPLLRVGQLVEVRGVSTAGDFSSCVRAEQFTVLGQRALPRPKRLSFSQLISGRWVCYWAELAGTIRSAKATNGSLEIDLAMDDGKVLVLIPEYPDWKHVLIGAKVVLRGPLSALYNNHRQARGVKIFVPGPQYISIIKPGPADPYALPAISPSEIGRYDVVADLAAETRVRGTVEAVEPGPIIYVSDSESIIAVEAYSSCAPMPGELVDVVGFRALVNDRPGLVDADCRTVGRGMPSEPTEVRPEQILQFNVEPSGDPTVFLHNSTRYDLKMIRTEGTLVQSSLGPEGLSLLLHSAGTEFSAALPQVAESTPMAARGSLLQLTGICVVSYDSYGRPLGFRIFLRQPSDIRVLRNPAFWTPRRLWIIIIVATLIGVSWIFLLRRRVQKQAVALQQATEREDAIHQLARTMQQVRLQKDFSSRVSVPNCPEIAHLGLEFNTMLSELHDSDLARKQAESKLRYQALTDELTGLPNRRALADELTRTLAAAERTEQLVALLYIDLDGFKLVNDTLGHRVGDLLLGQVAERMQAKIRKADIVARLGGDEFAVVLTMLQRKENAQRVATTLLETLMRSFRIEGQEIVVSASIGISLFPANSTDPGEILQQADSAMYAAKRSGKNEIVFFTPEIGASMRERRSMEQELRGALARGEISVHYQPEFDLASGKLVRFEALARWHHPVLGNVPPATFIPVAEESGLIVPLGAHILRQACAEAVRWQTRVTDPVQLAVNVSSIQFNREAFVGEVTQVLRETGLNAQLLQVELTESVMLQGSERAAANMRALRQLGITIAIDDFGTGYSCFSYLTRLPFSALKIDRAFIKDLGTRKEARALVQSLIALAHNFNMQVVVEGIETPDQLATIRELGANQVQGYLLGRPSPDPMSRLGANRDADQLSAFACAT